MSYNFNELSPADQTQIYMLNTGCKPSDVTFAGMTNFFKSLDGHKVLLVPSELAPELEAVKLPSNFDRLYQALLQRMLKLLTGISKLPIDFTGNATLYQKIFNLTVESLVMNLIKSFEGDKTVLNTLSEVNTKIIQDWPDSPMEIKICLMYMIDMFRNDTVTYNSAVYLEKFYTEGLTVPKAVQSITASCFRRLTVDFMACYQAEKKKIYT